MSACPCLSLLATSTLGTALLAGAYSSAATFQSAATFSSEGRSVKLSAPLVREDLSGTVTDAHLTHDGTRIVYRADRLTPVQFELFSRPLDGSGPSVRLNDPLPAEGDVGENSYIPGHFALGALERVVYKANHTLQNVAELYSVPADRSASPIRISQALAHVFSYKLDAAGTHAVYLTDRLYRVPIDGSAAPTVLAPGLSPFEYWISPDGTQVAFTVGFGFVLGRLYVVNAAGGTPAVFLAQSHIPSGLGITNFKNIEFAPDGLRLICDEIEDNDGDVTQDLFSVPLDGSQAPTQLNQLSYSGIRAFDASTLPVRVAYLGEELASVGIDGTQHVVLTAGSTNPDFRPILVTGTDVLFTAFSGSRSLYRVPIDGSQPALVIGPSADSFALVDPDTVAYITGTTPFRTLLTVPVAGGTPLLLTRPPFGGTGPGGNVQTHPDGQRLLFRGDLNTNGVGELYAVPLDGSAPPLRLNAPLGANDGDVLTYEIASDGARVAYRAGFPGSGIVGLFSVPADASSPAFQLNEPSIGEILGDVLSFQATADGERVVYRADQELDELFGLYAVGADTDSTPRPLSAGIESVRADFALSPTGADVVFQSDTSPRVLYAAPLAPPTPLQAPIPLDSSSGTFPWPFEIAPGGTHLVYRKLVFGAARELRSVAVDGQSPSILLHPPTQNGSVTDFQVSSDGRRVVFRSDLGQSTEFELYSVPIDGSTAPVRLNGPLVTGGDVAGFGLSPDGAWVVYLADRALDNRVELFSVPSDGSRAPRKLNDALPAGGDVTHFAIDPASARVVYRADVASDGRFDLFSVPLTGRLPPHADTDGAPRSAVRLLTALPASRAVDPGFLLVAGGTQVLYRADAALNGVIELLRVAADGSSAPVRLSADLVAGGDVTQFAVTPDGTRVVYLADQNTDGVVELYVVALAGGPVLALDPLPHFADVSAFRIAPGSDDVVYLADRVTNDVLELFRAPLDASAAPVRLNAGLPQGGDVQSGFTVLGGGRALYRADQEQDGVLELFLHLAKIQPVRLR